MVDERISDTATVGSTRAATTPPTTAESHSGMRMNCSSRAWARASPQSPSQSSASQSSASQSSAPRQILSEHRRVCTMCTALLDIIGNRGPRRNFVSKLGGFGARTDGEKISDSVRVSEASARTHPDPRLGRRRDEAATPRTDEGRAGGRPPSLWGILYTQYCILFLSEIFSPDF